MNKFEAILTKRGFDLETLLNDKKEYTITNLSEAAQIIKENIKNKTHICVVADYDCDGVMSGSILDLILDELKANYTIRFPRRMSEGYGISTKIIQEIPNNSLVITVDNGIAAVEAIDLAKEKGMTTIVIDHHKKRGDNILPNATCIVNPHIFRKEGEFEHYCGAGLAYMLAKELKLSTQTIQKANVLAAIATIQDVVPLIDHNRKIVKYGLALLNSKSVDLQGIYKLCEMLKIDLTTSKYEGITEDQLAFKIGPCINAMGRMLDDGASRAFQSIMHYKQDSDIEEVVKWNEIRKKETKEQENILTLDLSSKLTSNTSCLVLYAPSLHEGIIGINAAQICEKNNIPTIVFTNSHEEGVLKGSGRSTSDIHLKHQLDKVADHILKYGGHAGAAGLSIKKEELEAFTKAINEVTPKSSMGSNLWNYDLEVKEEELEEVFKVVRKYAPYGEGFPAPIIKVSNYKLHKNYGKTYRQVGEKGISLNGKTTEALSFDLFNKYIKNKTPQNLNIVGTLNYSTFSKKVQILINDFQANEEKKRGFLI